MPTYEHHCANCDHEWEDFYSMKVDPPTLCPSCGTEGQVKRLVSGGSGPGIMRRTGAEMKAGMAAETAKIRKRAQSDENFRANLIGEDKYHNDKLNNDAITKELINIGKDASAIKSTDTKPSAVRPKIKTSKGAN